MNGSTLLHPPPVCIEFGDDFVRLLDTRAGREFPIERQPGGRLAPASGQRVRSEISAFVNRSLWQPRVRAFCAIGARGVSLRRLAIPTSAGASLQQVLRLQIEAEFPLSPDQLAWGYQQVDGAPRPTGERQEVLVAAVKKETLEELLEILAECAVNPVFTLAPLARTHICPPSPSGCLLLNVERSYSELTVLDYAGPLAVRSLQWGEGEMVRALRSEPGLEQAGSLDGWGGATPGASLRTDTALDAALDKLASGLRPYAKGKRIYITGAGARKLAPQLAARLGSGCEPVESAPGEGHSAATVGLRQACKHNGTMPFLMLQVRPANGVAATARPAPRKWGALAAALGLAVLLLPQVEALVLEPGLSGKLAAIKADRARLPVIDRELDFLRYLRQNQPDYLDALYIFAKTAPPGTRFESLSMNRRGDVSLRATLRTPDQAVDFRSKLVESGFFSNVAVEEQVPAPNHHGLSLRMTARIKAASERLSLAILKDAQGTSGQAGAHAALSRATLTKAIAKPPSSHQQAPAHTASPEGGKSEPPSH
jgi:hypothetical protein